MDCDRCLEQLSARLDGELSAGETAELEAHLAQCPSCRALAQQLEQLRDGFSHLEEAEAPAGLARRVMDRIRKENSAGRVIPLFRRPQFKALAGLAACAVLCVGLYGAGRLGHADISQGKLSTDSSLGLYSLSPENASGELGADPAPYDAQAAPRANAALVDPEAAGAQTDAFDGEGLQPQSIPSQEDFSQVLTLDSMPEGAAELLSSDTVVSHSTADGSDTYSPLTPEQLDAIESLAQDQGITGDRTSSEEQEGPCALIILAN